jgi:hypothetical protein
MGIPLYFIFILLVAVILLATVAVYFQVYKQHINKALETTQGKRASMVPPYKVALVLTIISLLISILISYFAGYAKAYKAYEDELWVLSPSDVQAFYAEVKEIGEHRIVVEGLALNAENYRGEFQYDVWGEVGIYNKNSAIQLADLSAGDLVSVTLVTDRTGNSNVFKIELLSSEK